MLLLRNSFGGWQKGVKIHWEDTGPVWLGKSSITRTVAGGGKTHLGYSKTSLRYLYRPDLSLEKLCVTWWYCAGVYGYTQNYFVMLLYSKPSQTPCTEYFRSWLVCGPALLCISPCPLRLQPVVLVYSESSLFLPMSYQLCIKLVSSLKQSE